MYKYPKEKTTIEVKFLPNYNYETKKIGKHISETHIGVKDSINVSTLFFSVVSMNGEITILKYGIQIKKILQSFVEGCYINSDGLYISAKNNQKIYDEDDDDYSLTEYYLDKDGEVVLPFDTFNYKLNELEHRTDVVYKERFFPFDFASNLFFQFDIDWVMDGQIMKYDNFRLVEREPLWNEGDDKEPILNMYKDVKVFESIEEYKKNTSEKNPNILFGDKAFSERNRLYTKKDIENKEAELSEMKERYNENYNKEYNIS